MEEQFVDIDYQKAPELLTFQRCIFIRCRFRFSDLSEITTNMCRFEACDFNGARLNATIHTGSAFVNCTFTEADLFAAQFHDCSMTGSDFAGARLDGMEIVAGDWSLTNLRQAQLPNLSLKAVRFAEADLSEANLTNSDLRNADLRRTALAKTTLKGANLRGARMEGVDFSTVNLDGAKIDLNQAVMFAEAHGASVEV